MTRYVNQSEAWFPIDLCFQNTYASTTLAHDPALNVEIPCTVYRKITSKNDFNKSSKQSLTVFMLGYQIFCHTLRYENIVLKGERDTT